MWMRVPADRTVVVLDYNHVPYLHFGPAGVAVNRNSVMYYYNQVPPSVPPASLTRSAPVRWVRVSGGHAYLWHDGRLQDLSAQALLPGQRYLGVWRIPLLVDGNAATLSGGVWFRPAPSLAWFWPILVIVLCALAAWRVGSAAVDRMLMRVLALGVLGASLVGAGGHWLHGRPGIAVAGVLETLAIGVFVGWAALRVIRNRAGAWTLFAISVVGLWCGITLLPTLWHGYTLLAVPSFLARAATVICLGGGLALLPVVERVGDPLGRRGMEAGSVAVTVLALALLLPGCGSGAATTTPRSAAARLPARLLAQARPVGAGPAFHPPVAGSPVGACRARLGPRYAIHLEVFRANRVVLVATGVGLRDPLRMLDGRIVRARCYGAAVTLDPTGVVLVRRGVRVTLGQLFGSWGVPLRGRLYVDGFRRPGGAGAAEGLKLTRHAEIVIETGPYVPPHHAYRFPQGA